MDDALRVGRIQSIGDLNGQIEQFVGLEGAASQMRCLSVWPSSSSIAMKVWPSDSSMS